MIDMPEEFGSTRTAAEPGESAKAQRGRETTVRHDAGAATTYPTGDENGSPNPAIVRWHRDWATGSRF